MLSQPENKSMKIAGVTGLGGLWAWQMLDQSIGIDETNTFQITDLGGLWALEWAWHAAETKLGCARSSGIFMPNPKSLALTVSEIFVRTDGQTDMARSTRLVILIKNIYTLWGRKRFCLLYTSRRI